MYTYTDNSYTAGTQTIAEREVLFQQYAQAQADALGDSVTGKYLLPDGTYYVAIAYPNQSSTASSAPASQPTSKTTAINKDTSSLIQRGIIQQPGYYGNQELKSSNDSFNNAVNIGAQLSGFASLLQNKTAPANYTRTKDNYILTTLEKQTIANKSQELASYGVVPYDVLSNFFYILAASENYSDLQYISGVVNIPEMDDPNLVRNITGVCSLTNIYKVGYLANGVASVNQIYGTQYSGIQQYADSSQSSIGGILGSANLGVSLGVIGPILINNAYRSNNFSGPLSSSPSLTNVAITNTINSLVNAAQGPQSNIDKLNAISNPTFNIGSSATSIGASLIGSLLNQTPLGGSLGSLGALGGIAAGFLLSQSGGNSVGGLMSELLLGKRITTSKRANNPMLTPPSYAGKAFFGEAPVSLPATDQVFCRKVGAFSHVNGGSGVVSFGMQNFSSFGGSLSIASVVSRLITGSPEVPSTNTFFGQHVNTMTGNLCNVLNVPITSTIEMRRSDNAIPFMLGFSGVMAGESFSPFGSSPFTNGWKLASSTGNDLQRYNPQFLITCQTSL